MAEIKGFDADRFVARPGDRHAAYLLYGPDTGLVSERADTLCKALGADATDPFSLVRVDADAAAADPARIADEANTVSMFGGRRVIRISGTTRRNLAAALRAVLDRPPAEARVVVEAGELRRDQPLRKLFEGSAVAAAIACYGDNEAAIDRLIGEGLAGLAIDAEARELLRSRLGADRRASRGEIEKLRLACTDAGRVRLADVRELTGEPTEAEADDIIDATVAGEVARAQRLLDRHLAGGGSPDMLLLFLLRRFQTLQAVRHKFDSGAGDAASAVAAMRPPVPQFRRGLWVSSVSSWKEKEISKVLTRLDQAARDIRMGGGPASALASATVLAIAMEAAQSGRR